MEPLTIQDLEHAADGYSMTIWMRAWLTVRSILRHEDDQRRIDEDLSSSADPNSPLDAEARAWLHEEWNRHAAEVVAGEASLSEIKKMWPEEVESATAHALMNHGRWLLLKGQEGEHETGTQAEGEQDVGG